VKVQFEQVATEYGL